MDTKLRKAKLARLLDVAGFESLEELAEAVFSDSVSPAICVEPDCDHVAEMEPDQDAGYCDACGKQSVTSALVLAGLI